MQDIRHAVRRLAATPLFTLGALAVVALAIGANTAAFTVVDHLLLAPPPFHRPEEVVNIYQDSDEGDPSSTSFPAYRDMATMGTVFASVAATSPDGATLETEQGSSPVAIEYTTSSLMETLGMTPARGRWFDAGMDHVGAGNYAVVSHYTWRNRFGSDPDLVGRVLRFNGEPVEVIGVGPTDYNGMGGFMVTDFWLSISSVGIGGSFRIANLDRRTDHWYDVKARLAPGVTVPQAQEAMNVLAGRLADEFPELNEGRGITVFPTRDIRMHPQEDATLLPVAGLLMAVVVLILVLASSNLGSLLLIRGVGRSQEMAVRRAMGAAPSRVARLFLSEALLLSFAGGALGLLAAQWLLGLTGALPLDLPLGGNLDLHMDGRVLLFSLVLMVGAGLFFGWAPAVQSLATDVTRALREDRRTAGGRRLSRFRNLMVSIQVAVSLILVLGAGLMVRTLSRYYQVDPGVDADRVAVLRTDFSPLGLAPEERGVVLRQITDRFAALPGVESVAVASRLPLSGGGSTTTVVEGYEPPAGTGSVELDWVSVTPGYFRTMGIELLDGRRYEEDDRRVGGRGPVILNRAASDRFWGGVQPVGRRVRPQGEPDAWSQVIGVASTSKVRSLAESPTPLMYYVMGEGGTTVPYILVRTSRDPAGLLAPLRTQLQAVNPRLPVVQLRTLEGLVGDSIATPRMAAMILSLFSALALLLACLGIYTIVAFSVAGRSSEIGIRMALGARGGRVVSGVMREMGRTVALGLAVGGMFMVLVFPRLRDLFFGVELISVGTLLPSLAILLGAVSLASWIPARRAARVNPVEALRGE
jgi:predicted permease